VYGRVAESKKMKRPNLTISSFKKGQILKIQKIKITRFKVRISQNIASFVQIPPKKALKYTIFYNILNLQNGHIILFLANHFKKFQI